MVTAAEMLRRWRRLDIYQEVADGIEQTKEEAIKLNQSQLFLRGEKSDGTKLKPYRSDAYARLKNRLNASPGYGTPDAYRTGGMYRGMFVIAHRDAVIFDSTAQTATFMIERDGPKIFGLTVASKDVYKQSYMPIVQRSIKNKTGTI